MKFSDILPYIESGNWECDFDLRRFDKEIERMEKEEGLILCPDFQRGHVWTEEQQIAFVEHILRGGKNGKVVYLNHPDWSHVASKYNNPYREMVCVDGLQRITAIRRFVRGELAIFGGHYITDFDDTPRGAQGMKININELQNRREVLAWYLQMNTGGTPHTKEELERVQKLYEEEHNEEI